MAMGSQSTVAISDEMQKAKSNCQEFRREVATLVQQLDACMTTLMTGFQGDAANGLRDFYNKNIVAFFEKGGVFDQYLGMFDMQGEGLFDAIENALIGGEGLDPELGKNNSSLGQGSAEE